MSDTRPSNYRLSELVEFLDEAIKAEPGKCLTVHRSWANKILAALRAAHEPSNVRTCPVTHGHHVPDKDHQGCIRCGVKFPLAAQPPCAAARDVLAERERQRADLWGDSHDDEHRDGVMAQAAAAYALRATHHKDKAHDLWPWDDEWWKPKDTRRDLVRAGALILAEIERLDIASETKCGAPVEETTGTPPCIWRLGCQRPALCKDRGHCMGNEGTSPGETAATKDANPWCDACGGVHPGIACPRLAAGEFEGNSNG